MLLLHISQNFVSLDELICELGHMTVNKCIGIHIGSGYHDYPHALRKLHRPVCS